MTAILIAAALLAGDTDARQPAPEDAIVVTGLRAETQKDALPISIDTIDRQDIALEGLATLADALDTAPGVQAVQSGPAGSLTSVFVRGGNSDHTLALYDGIRINDPSSASGAFNFGSDLLGDAGRIEIVRGPLSSLYGSDAVGGVVNILPRTAPEAGFEPFAAASFGEFSTLRGLAGAGWAGERARGVISIEALDSDGYDVTPARMSTTTGDPDGAEMAGLIANGSVDLTSRVVLDVLYRIRSSEAEFDTFSGGTSGAQRADDPDLRTEDTLTLAALGLTVKASETLSGRLRIGRVSTDLESLDGASVTDRYDGERDFAKATGEWRARPDLLVSFGAEAWTDSIDTDTAFNNALSVSEDAASVFLAGQYAVTEALSLTGSVRLDDYEAFGTETTGNLGAVYALPALNTRLRASWGTSFKAPSLSERFASSLFVVANPDLRPEEGESVEIGFDTALESLSFGAVWYDGEVENLIENVFDFTTFTGTNRNIGRADLSGWEAWAEWAPVEALTLSADYTHTDAANADTGARLLRRPETSWSARAIWRLIDIATVSLRYRHVGARQDVTYDDAGFFVSSSGTVPSYETVDLTGTLDLWREATLFVSAKNLFDETYEEPAAFAAPPRAVTVGVRWAP
ncbi:MAG: TonB-dependent receptor [Oceanicaulis sp.]